MTERPVVAPALAAYAAGVSAVTLRSWVHRGHITRHPGGYDLDELLHRLDTRDASKIPPRP